MLSSNAPGGPFSEQQQKPLEILLLEKNRYLQNENTQVKNRLSDVQNRHDKLVVDNKELVSSNLEQKRLIIELEKDLMNLAGNKTTDNMISSNGTTAASFQQSALLNESSGESTTGSILNDLDTTGELALKSSSRPSNNDNKDGADMSLFNIVSNQRERFRVRVQELEGENMSAKQQIIFLTNEIDRLRSDNVKLYEKIKYLQSATSKSTGGEYESIDLEESIGGGAGLLNKYTSEYEKRLDPFSKFNYREKQKRYSNLKLHDKFTFQFGKFILGNKTARLVFAGYFLVIHLLIFISLYFMAHSSAYARDLSAECASSYKDHMAQVHGVNKFDPMKHADDHKH
jgi:homeobox protein cut-like